MIFLLFSLQYSNEWVLVKTPDTTNLNGLKIIKHLFGDWYRVALPTGADALKFSESLKKSKGIEDASPDYICKALMVPNDPYYEYQWNLRKFIKLEEAWDIAGGGSPDIIIGILDTGCSFEEYPVPDNEKNNVIGNSYHIYDDYNRSSFVEGYDFVNEDEHPNDDNGHGTIVSGVIIEATNNGRGVAGIAFNTRVMPVKVLGYDRFGKVSDLSRGIIYAVKHGARILNMSLGNTQDVGILRDAVTYASNNNVIMVAASGNDGTEGVYYPAAYPEVIAVGAYDSLGKLASYSNYGVEIEFLGPGGDIIDSDTMSVYQQGFRPYVDDYNLAILDTVHYYGLTGTSLACPHITALCALMLSVAPELRPENVRYILRNTAQDFGLPGWDMFSGYGIPDFKEAVRTAYFLSHFESLNDILTIHGEFGSEETEGASVLSTGNFWLTQDTSYILPVDLKLINSAGQVVKEFTLHETYNLSIEKSGVYFLYGSGRAGIKLIVTR